MSASPTIHDQLVSLITCLDQAEIDWDGENIADAVWLSRFVEGVPIQQRDPSEPKPPPAAQPPSQTVVPPPINPSEPDLSLYPEPPPASAPDRQPQPQQGLPFQTPTVPSLRHTLAIGRSLRPLMRKVDSYTQMVLDEEATAEQTAEQHFCTTIVKPAKERWLEVALVIEQSSSSFLWQATIRDFLQVLERQGAFRTIKVWYLQTEEPANIQLFAKRPMQTIKQQPRSPKELLDASGRRLILLLSDCISPAWRQGVLHEDYLCPWARQGPVAIAQMFPSHLWSRTALSAGIRVHFGALRPGMPNQQLQFQDVPIGFDNEPEEGLKLPIVTLEPAMLHPWARMLSGCGESWSTGVWFEPEWRTYLPEAGAVVPGLTAQQLLQRFITTASPMARRLGGLMALVPVHLPIIYLLQETLLSTSTPLHVAEVFMSGLLERVDESLESGASRTPFYEFILDDHGNSIRDLLIDTVPIPTSEFVLDRVSEYVGERVGKSIYSFTALLMLEQELGNAAGTELIKFARVTKQVLRRMGGDYAALADIAATAPVVSSSPRQLSFDLPFKQLLNIIDARLIDPTDPPKSGTETFAVATLVRQETPQSAAVPTFEFTVATLTRQGQTWKIERQKGTASYFMETLPDEQTLEMVGIPSGTFMMGSPADEAERHSDESPQHKVTVEPFFLGRYPITQAQWRVVAQLPQIVRKLEPEPANFKGDLRPVEQVSWDDAVEFCARLSQHTGREYRLPSEAEWEYACRAGTDTPFHFGATISAEIANYIGTSTYADGPSGEYRKETIPVDHFSVANAFGLSDMHGNVWEWCQDDWHGNYDGAPVDGRAWLNEDDNRSQKVCRGGSWLYDPDRCRSAYRLYSDPDAQGNPLGLRVACSAPRTL